MKCLYCGKEIKANAMNSELENRWHKSCVKKFFGIPDMPLLEISPDLLNKLARETINKGFTVPGVQKKLSLHLSTEKESRLTIVDYPTGYILKPQTDEYSNLPEFENLAMQMAKVTGIKIVPQALIKCNNEYAYITKRIDRELDNSHNVQMFAMEDFCQLSERITADKYKGSYEKCGKIISKYSSMPGLDLTEFYTRVVFSFIIGNSDMHLKNFSLIETAPKSRIFTLAPAYDMLPVNIILPEDTEEMALTLNGKKRRLKKQDFISLSKSCNINEKATEKIISKICNLKDIYFNICDNSYLPKEYNNQVKALIDLRVQILQE